jgi:hypothetical protein
MPLVGAEPSGIVDHAITPFADSLNRRSTLHVSIASPAATAGVVFNVM